VIKSRGYAGNCAYRLEAPACARYALWALGCWLCVTGLAAPAGPLVNTDSPIGFFTNVANRLLQSQLGLSLDRIQVFPTNQYTPSVHRVLQVTANLYDATTNRSDTAYPYLPSVFRPVFANQTSGTNRGVFIVGYEEVTNASVLARQMVDLSDSSSRQTLRPLDDQHMVYNIPLVIGAKKGFPNFNEFAMQTLVQVARKLQFSRQNGPNSPISQTNQMFLVAISNAFGIEAWNSYVTSFPRPLRLYVWPDISIVMTNETGMVLNPTSQRYQPGWMLADLTGDAWPGYNRAFERYSFQIPLSTNLLFLTNSTYQYAAAQFVPPTGTFEQVVPRFCIPHWWLEVKARLRFAVVDTSVNPTRIVDYVNLADQNLVNLTDVLTWGGQRTNVYVPDGAYGSLWCTNHYPAVADESLPTYGVLNQVQISLGQQPAYGEAVWNSAMNAFPAGIDKLAAIDSFRNQFGLGPLFSHPAGTVFYPSNAFVGPFQPVRNIFLVTSWQANDPLVHYTVNDLTSLTRTNLMLDHLPTPAPTANLGRVNLRYEPWGGNPAGGGSSSTTKLDLRIKDPLMLQSDSWDFPTNLLSNVGWLGRVHRGTPWQTLYLKSASTDLSTWMVWTGNGQLVSNGSGSNGVTYDAWFTQPTNDWRMESLVVSLLSTNDPRSLASVNQPNSPAWCGLLDGLTVLTNSAPGQFDPIIISSNSPQAATVAASLDRARSTRPGQRFGDVADILAVLELSIASPWLDTNGVAYLASSMNDEACEAIPAQLLTLLRPDSLGAASEAGGMLQLQFSGSDGYAYVVQTSSNLLDWIPVSTNYPANGAFNFVDNPPPGSPRRFYRSALLP
jgi:hypothetical protein